MSCYTRWNRAGSDEVDGPTPLISEPVQQIWQTNNVRVCLASRPRNSNRVGIFQLRLRVAVRPPVLTDHHVKPAQLLPSKQRLIKRQWRPQ